MPKHKRKAFVLEENFSTYFDLLKEKKEVWKRKKNLLKDIFTRI